MGAAVGLSFLGTAGSSSESSEKKAPWVIEPLSKEGDERRGSKKESKESKESSMGKISFSTRSPSTVSTLPSLGFSNEERIENERVQKLQQITGSFFVHHAYNGFPTKAKKQKDPLAPLWIEVSLEKLETLIEQNKQKADSQKEIQIDMKLLQTVPTGIIIDRRGDVKIIFSKMDVTYNISAHDVQRAMFGSSELIVPTPPFLKDAGPYELTLQWILPFPTGITQKAEIQYVDGKKFTPKSVQSRLSKPNNDGQPDDQDGFTVVTKHPKESDWRYITTCMYETRPVDTFSWNNLQPGKCYYFRVRLWTHQGRYYYYFY